MTAPTVRGFATATNTTDAQPAVSINLPTRASGDLLIVFAACDTTTSATAITQTSNWTAIDEEAGGSDRFGIWARIATNDANDAASIAGSNNQDMSVNMIAITTGTHGVSSGTIASDIIHPAAATGASGNADPPNSGTVSSKDWLAIAACCVDLTNSAHSISAAPTNYTTGAQLQKSASSTSSVGLGVGYRALSAATSENPGTFTNDSNAWIAKTLLIPPFVSVSATADAQVANVTVTAPDQVPVVVLPAYLNMAPRVPS